MLGSAPLGASSLGGSGQVETFIATYTLPASSGTYVITGYAEPLDYYDEPLLTGSYTITVGSASFFVTHIMWLQTGSYVVNGGTQTYLEGYLAPLSGAQYILTGSSPAIFKNWKLPLTSGAYVLTPKSVKLIHVYPLTLGGSSYTVTLGSVQGLYGLEFTYAPTAYRLAGGPTFVLKYYRILLESTSGYVLTPTTSFQMRGRYRLTLVQTNYNLDGVPAALDFGRKLSDQPGSYVVTGRMVALKVNRTMTLSIGRYAIVGSTIGNVKTNRLALAAGAYQLTAGHAGFVYDLTLSLAIGSYGITGRTTSFSRSRVLQPQPGNYNLFAPDMELSYSLLAVTAIEAIVIFPQVEITVAEPVNGINLAPGSFWIEASQQFSRYSLTMVTGEYNVSGMAYQEAA